MKLTITATEKITDFEGVPVRVWEGVSETGVPCIVFVHRIAVREDHDASQFEAELLRKLPPGVKLDLRHIL